MTISTTTPIPRKARPTDRPAVAAIMADAWFDDPVFGWLVPDDGHRRRILPAFFELAAQICAKHEETWCVGSDVEEGVVGAAIWTPAGVEPMSETEGQAFAIRCGELAGPYADRWEEFLALLDDNHPHHAEHDYLWFLAVRPAWQGLGHGSALLRAVLDRADRTGTPAYLDATSPDNRRLYERHGFRVIGELAVAGGPPVWQMWREP
jgi:ribosomal protein S18 acetylase RimI-like enzyme